MRRLNTSLWHLCAVAALCFLPSAVFVEAAEAGDAGAGKALYEENCQSCHGPNGNGKGEALEVEQLRPRNFEMAAFKFDTDADWQNGTDKDLADVIKNGPGAYGGSLLMPAWDDLSREEVQDLIAFVRSLER